jgi:HlyD family secretion protein
MSQGQNKQPIQNQSKFAKYFNQFLQFLAKLVKYIDRFINFIVKPNDHNRNDVVQYARPPIIFGTYVIILFFGVGFLWAAIAPLNSAAGATGVLINDSHRQLIQNSHGGTVKAIYVKLGDKVKKGQKLLEIEDLAIKAKYEQNLNSYRNSLANLARLSSEKDNLDIITFSDELIKDQDNDEVSNIMNNQVKLFNSRKEAHKSHILNLEQKKEQDLKQLESLKSKSEFLKKHLIFVKDRLDGQKKLFVESHTTKANLQKAEADYEQSRNEDFTNKNDITRNEQLLLQHESELEYYKNNYLSEILKEIKETSSQLYSLREEVRSYKDILDKEVIRSPVDGVVNVINVHTIGGHVSPHSQQAQNNLAIMEITPDNEKLIIDARIPQSKIAYVHVGLESVIRFSAFKSRTSPAFKGKIVAMSSDSIEDPKALQSLQTKGMSDDAYFYPAKIEIDMDDFNKLAKGKNLELKAGMRAEIMIITGKRTLIRYLLDPITDSVFRAFNEK